jgi:hypothetical protein
MAGHKDPAPHASTSCIIDGSMRSIVGGTLAHRRAGQPLLAVYDRSLLHLSGLLLNLLQYDRTQEMRVVLIMRLPQNPVR